MFSKPLLCIIGPTASGKTNLSLELAHAFESEILSVDSRQVYTGLDIGTGKIMPEQMQGIPHHGIDLCLPSEQYDMAQFQKYGANILEKLHDKQTLPILCGGTGLWMDALCYDFHPAPKSDPNRRTELENLYDTSPKLVWDILYEKDPQSAEKLSPNNKHHLIRWTEIVLTTNQPRQPVTKTTPYKIIWITTQLEKATHDALIEQRV